MRGGGRVEGNQVCVKEDMAFLLTDELFFLGCFILNILVVFDPEVVVWWCPNKLVL